MFERGARAEVDAFLDASQGLGRTRSQRARKRERVFPKTLQRIDLIQQTQAQGFFGPDPVAGHHEFHGLGRANQAGQKEEAAPVGDQADLHKALGKERLVRAEPEVAA